MSRGKLKTLYLLFHDANGHKLYGMSIYYKEP